MKKNQTIFSDVFISFDVGHLLRFICLFVPMYYIHLFTVGITDPRNYYSPFIDHYLNYVSWIDNSILYTSNLIVHAFGLHSFVIGRLIKIPAGASVALWPPCAGLGIMSFWIAFVVSHGLNWKSKLYWALTGIVIIWFINCWRIAVLLMSLQNKWATFKFLDHHEMFNIAAYCVVLLLIYLFNKRSRKEISYN